MRVYQKAIKLLLIQLFLILLTVPVKGYAENEDGITVVGREYNTYIYATYAEDSSTTITFEENLALLIGAYDGFGLYLPIANLVIAVYWAPDYSNKKDLLLILSGVAISDFIAGGGIAMRDYQYYGLFLFSGYSE